MEIKATHKNARISAQKARLIVRLINRMNVSDALNSLDYTSKKSALLVKKVLNSAISNAEHNHGMDIDDLFISNAHVDEGYTLKRFMPRSKGRANKILKRCCHITVRLAEKS